MALWHPVWLETCTCLLQVWTHPDGFGTFEVVSLADTAQMSFTGIRALDKLGSHGKLIVDPDLLDDSVPVGYATNTGVQNARMPAHPPTHQHILVPKHASRLMLDAYSLGVWHAAERFFFEIDLANKSLIKAHDYGADPASNLSDATICVGLHGIAYSPVNKHVYGECTRGGGIIEFDSVAKKVVTRWANLGGSIYQTRNERFLSVTDKSASK